MTPEELATIASVLRMPDGSYRARVYGSNTFAEGPDPIKAMESAIREKQLEELF